MEYKVLTTDSGLIITAVLDSHGSPYARMTLLEGFLPKSEYAFAEEGGDVVVGFRVTALSQREIEPKIRHAQKLFDKALEVANRIAVISRYVQEERKEGKKK